MGKKLANERENQTVNNNSFFVAHFTALRLLKVCKNIVSCAKCYPRV